VDRSHWIDMTKASTTVGTGLRASLHSGPRTDCL